MKLKITMGMNRRGAGLFSLPTPLRFISSILLTTSPSIVADVEFGGPVEDAADGIGIEAEFAKELVGAGRAPRN